MTEGVTWCDAVASELRGEGTAPDWIELFRPGLNMARDGRQFSLSDARAVIAASLRNGAELPVDYEHQTERKDAVGPVPAAGWITELAERGGGIWAKVSWTRDAARMIANREYRFISPAFLMSKDGVVRAIKGAGLVHWPALNLTQLASRTDTVTEHTDDTDTLQTLTLDRAELAALLGVEAEAVTASALKTRLSQSAPDPARFVPIDAVKELLASRNDAQRALTEAEASTKVDNAVLTGGITPAMRTWALELCRSDPEAFDQFLSVSPSFGHLFEKRSRTTAGTARGRVFDDQTLAVCSQLGIRPEDLGE